MQDSVMNNVILDIKLKNNNNKTKKSNIKILAGAGIEPGTPRTQADALLLHHRVNWEQRL